MNEKSMQIQSEIAGLKQILDRSDYKALKHVDGVLSEEEYAPIKAERQALRDRINELEISLAEVARGEEE